MDKLISDQLMIKKATVGLIGDGRKKVRLDTLYPRVQDQAERHGKYAPSWPAFCEALDGLEGYARAGWYVTLPTAPLEMVRCKWCKEHTTATGLKECSGCWELRTRIEHNRELARRILEGKLGK